MLKEIFHFDIMMKKEDEQIVNKRLTVKNKFGKTVYCVLSDAEPFEKHMMDVLALQAGCGFSVVFRKDSVDVRDYRTNETVGTFEILSFAYTDENVVLDWRECSI